MEKTDMDSLVTVLAAVEKNGFTSQFEVTHEGLLSLATNEKFQPYEVKIIHFYRFEGESNPDDSAILYAIETHNHEKGTLVDSYGASADSATAAFFKKVENIQK